MATFEILDVIELATATGRWPRGTTGTIVEIGPGSALVEVADDRGHTLDVVTLPLDALSRVENRQEQLPA